MRWVVWGVSLGMVLLAALFVGAQFLIPGDTAVLQVTAGIGQTELTVQVRQPKPGGLQTGDAVLALDGRPVDDWLHEAWRSPLASAGDVQTTRIKYTVRRAGQVLDVTQTLVPLSVRQGLSGTWSYLIFMAYMLAVGVLLMLRRPDLPASRALLLFGSAIAGSSLPYFLGLRASDLRFGWLVTIFIVAAVPLFGLLSAGALHFVLVFPVMRPALKRRSWLVPALYLFAWVPYTIAFLAGWNPSEPPAATFLRIVAATIGMTMVYFPLAVISSIRTFRLTTEARLRRQLRWIVWGLAVAQVPWLLLAVLPEVIGGQPLLPDVAVGLLWCFIPTSVAIAILREGLFDIDTLINRTLVYGGLSGALAVVYFVTVVALQAGLRLVTGQGGGQLAVVLSTLVIAALAAPLRGRLQILIDRRFYRKRYDAARTLAAFGSAVRHEVDLESLSGRLVRVVEETMQPEAVGLWLPESGSVKRET